MNMKKIPRQVWFLLIIMATIVWGVFLLGVVVGIAYSDYSYQSSEVPCEVEMYKGKSELHVYNGFVKVE